MGHLEARETMTARERALALYLDKRRRRWMGNARETKYPVRREIAKRIARGPGGRFKRTDPDDPDDPEADRFFEWVAAGSRDPPNIFL